MTRAALPPGQRARPDLPRFGLQWFAYRLPEVPERPTLRIGGAVVRPAEIALSELAELPRVEQTSDFHCVTSWSTLGLQWGGVRFRDVFEQLIVPRVDPAMEARWLHLTGLDGYRTVISLHDALAEEVLLADRLDGVPLTGAHGAPVRLLAPAQYGWKSVKGLASISFHTRFPWLRSSYVLDHPRGRVAQQERGRLLPAGVLRGLFAPQIGSAEWLFRRAEERRRH